MMETDELKKLLIILGTQIRNRRKTLGLTQEDLAEAAGLSVNFIGRIEIGEKTPSLGTITCLAKVLNVEASDLFEREHVKWLDEVQELVRKLPEPDAEFAVSKFKEIVDYLIQVRGV